MINEVNLVLAGCLRRLLKNRFILKNKSEVWYRNIIDQRKLIEEFVHAMAAKLIINEELGVIYLQALSDEYEEMLSYQLGSKITLKKFGTHALLIMRKRRSDYFLNPDVSGKCFISKIELKEILEPFLQNIEQYKEDKKLELHLRETIRDLRELQILFETADGSEIYEISAVCDVILPLEEIHKLELNIMNYMKNAVGVEAN